MSEAAAVEKLYAPEHYTTLDLYTRCPYAYKCDRDGAQEQPTEVLAFGRQVHEFAELYARHCIAEGVPRDYDWGREQADGYEDPEVRARCIQFMRQMSFDPALVVADDQGVERDFEVVLPNGKPLAGRADLVEYNPVEKTLFVTDYKSGFPYAAGPVPPPQLECYGWAMLQEGFGEVVEVRLARHFVANGERQEWTVYPEDLEPSWAMAVMRRIAADNRFEPTPSAKACGWCGHRHLCPVVQADPLLHPATLAEAREAWGQYQAMYARAGSVKDAVRDYLQAHELDSLPGVEERPGWYPTDPTRPPAREVKHSPVEVMQAVVQVLGEDVAAKLVDARALGKAVDDLGVEGFGDAPELDTLMELTAEREPGNPRWSDSAPKWWRELTKEGSQ